MSKQLFYVPVVLVIGAQSGGEAQSRADELLDAFAGLKPKNLDGWILPDEFIPSAASSNWLHVDSHAEYVSDEFITIKEQ